MTFSADGRVGLPLIIHGISCGFLDRPPYFRSESSQLDLPAAVLIPEEDGFSTVRREVGAAVNGVDVGGASDEPQV